VEKTQNISFFFLDVGKTLNIWWRGVSESPQTPLTKEVPEFLTTLH